MRVVKRKARYTVVICYAEGDFDVIEVDDVARATWVVDDCASDPDGILSVSMFDAGVLVRTQSFSEVVNVNDRTEGINGPQEAAADRVTR